MLDGSARLKGRAPTVEVSAHVPTCRPPFGGGSFRFHVSLLNGTLRRGSQHRRPRGRPAGTRAAPGCQRGRTAMITALGIVAGFRADGNAPDRRHGPRRLPARPPRDARRRTTRGRSRRRAVQPGAPCGGEAPVCAMKRPRIVALLALLAALGKSRSSTPRPRRSAGGSARSIWWLVRTGASTVATSTAASRSATPTKRTA